MSLAERLQNGEAIKIVTYGPCFFANNLRPNPWVIALQKHFDKHYPGQVQIVIRGLGGINSLWGVQQLSRRVIAEKPDYVMMEWAINDSKQNRPGHPSGGVTKEQCKANLDRMVSQINSKLPDCQVVLWTTTPIGTKGRDKSLSGYYEVNRQYAKEKQLPLVDAYPEFIRLKEQDPKTYWMCLTEDEGHLTRFGAKRVVLPLLLGMINENEF